jgi:hypothetical protein
MSFVLEVNQFIVDKSSMNVNNHIVNIMQYIRCSVKNILHVLRYNWFEMENPLDLIIADMQICFVVNVLLWRCY